MRYFRVAEPKATELTLYPFVCWHVGAPQADYKFIDSMVQRVKDDPTARWVYMGDGGECVTKQSKGMIYEQTMNPQEQFNWLVSKLFPIRSKGLFGVKGNHGWRTFKESGLGFDESLMLALQLPYLGTAAFTQLIVNRSSYDLYVHHGIDSGVNVGTKVNKAKAFENFLFADAIFSAHSHVCMELPPRYIAYIDGHNTHVDDTRIKWRATREYICGCAYDSRTGYAEDKGYPPLLPAHLAVTFSGKRSGDTVIRQQTCQIIRPF